MDYQSNSDKSKEEKGEKQVSKVVTGQVYRKPEGLGKRFKNTFFGGDLKSSAKFVLADVLLPSARDMLWDAITRGSGGIIYGDPANRRRTAEYRPTVRYDNPQSRSFREPRETIINNPRRGYLPDQLHSYRQPQRMSQEDIIFQRREDAELVVERLIDVVDHYQIASMADFLELAGQSSSPIDHKWGWSSLSTIEIRSIRDGYLIELPPAEPIT